MKIRKWPKAIQAIQLKTYQPGCWQQIRTYTDGKSELVRDMCSYIIRNMYCYLRKTQKKTRLEIERKKTDDKHEGKKNKQ